MPIPSESFQALEDAINRLAAESILAQVGRDDGLVPAYSLLGDLRDLCSTEASLCEPVATTHRALEALLDSARPFDEASLGQLRQLVEWLPVSVDCIKCGNATPPFGTAGDTVDVTPDTVTGACCPIEDKSAPADVMLVLHLEENQELLGEFYGEAVDHLQQIEAALLALDQQPDNPEALNSIFRSFHTIKGNAGFLGLVPMQTLAHEVESLLDLARNQKLRLNAAIITVILRSRDALQMLTQQVALALEKGQLPNQIVPVGHLIRSVKKLAANPGSEDAEVPATVVLTVPAPVASDPLVGTDVEACANNPITPFPVADVRPETHIPNQARAHQVVLVVEEQALHAQQRDDGRADAEGRGTQHAEEPQWPLGEAHQSPSNRVFKKWSGSRGIWRAISAKRFRS